MVAKFRLQAEISTVSVDRMFAAVRSVGGMLPNDKLKLKLKFPRLDLVETLLAHQAEADSEFGNIFQLRNFIKI